MRAKRSRPEKGQANDNVLDCGAKEKENSNKFNATQQTLGRTLGHVTGAEGAQGEARLAGAGIWGCLSLSDVVRSVGRCVGLGLRLSECVAKFRPLTFLFRHALLIRNVVRVQYELNSPNSKVF